MNSWGHSGILFSSNFFYAFEFVVNYSTIYGNIKLEFWIFFSLTVPSNWIISPIQLYISPPTWIIFKCPDFYKTVSILIQNVFHEYFLRWRFYLISCTIPSPIFYVVIKFFILTNTLSFFIPRNLRFLCQIFMIFYNNIFWNYFMNSFY